MSSGTALLIVALWLVQRRGWRPLHERVLHLLARIDIALIVVEFFIILPYILHQALGSKSQFESVKLILGGEFTSPFWVIAVAVRPARAAGDRGHRGAQGVAARSHESRFMAWIESYGAVTAATLVLVGGVSLRWVFVYAGQVARLLPG